MGVCFLDWGRRILAAVSVILLLVPCEDALDKHTDTQSGPHHPHVGEMDGLVYGDGVL